MSHSDQATTHREHQAHYFDHDIDDPEFEITRPRSGGRFYEHLMDFKIRTVVELLGQSLEGCSVLNICSGSGMDAELLLRHGPRVTCLDISVGALNRAAERARRFGLTYALVGGDAESLPFPTGAFDYVFVHDGLHHLDKPQAAIDEMVRVSRRGVLITEPADAALTNLAIRLRLMSATEPAGNTVFRFDPKTLQGVFAALGLHDVRYGRYLVRYFHRPGRLFRLLDRPGLYEAGQFALKTVGRRLLGPAGNKLAFVALRPQTRNASSS